jgi:DNA-binding CsgD family transcriptional regulator
VPALVSVGLVRARRGDPEAWPPLDEAHALVERSGELQGVAPVAAARAEAAWLAGQHQAVGIATAPAFQLALRRRSRWLLGELASWRRRAGIQEQIPAEVAQPYELELRGEWRQAAELWTVIGCPYEAAFALAQCGEEDALRRALEGFRQLDARPMASIVARTLRRLGVRAIPRGPLESTRANAAGLTAREVEVLSLVAEGLPNAQIANRLYLSLKTVEHHISSVLSKLGVRTRGEAVREAVRQRLIDFPAGSRE